MKAVICALASVVGFGTLTSAAPVDYVKEIQPILAKNCVGCHNAQKARGKVRLDSVADAVKNDVIVPGSSKTSALYQSLIGDGASQMPPKGRNQLDKNQIALIKTWIDQGAKAPDNGAKGGNPIVANNKPVNGNNPPRRGEGRREREREKREMDREKSKREKEDDD
jgi:mono/diheme cytochrome c family protein